MLQSHFEKENQLQAKEVAEREAMINAAQLQAEQDHGQLELYNKKIVEVRFCCYLPIRRG